MKLKQHMINVTAIGVLNCFDHYRKHFGYMYKHSPHYLISIGLWLALLNACCVSCYSQQETNQELQYAQFKHFLSQSLPPIKKVVLYHSKLLYGKSVSPAKYDVPYEASLQTGSYYIKQLGDGYRPTNSKAIAIEGLSCENYWNIDGDGHVIVENLYSSTPDSMSPLQTLVESRRSVVDEVLNLGILYLDRGTMIWSNNNFQAQTSEPQWGTVFGRIRNGDGLRPDSIEYAFSRLKSYSYIVTYQYNNDGRRPDWMPSATLLAVTSVKYTPEQNSLLITNLILTLELGTVDHDKCGYKYTDFLPPGDSLADGKLEIFSNGVGRVLIGDHFETVSKVQNTFVLPPRSRWKARLVFALFALSSSIVFGWYLTRCHSTVKPLVKSKKT